MDSFSEEELHALVDEALEIKTPEPRCLPTLSYLEIGLIEDFHSLMLAQGIDTNIREEILKNLKAKLPKQTTISLQSLRNQVANCIKCKGTISTPVSAVGNMVDPKILFILASPSELDKAKLIECLNNFDFPPSDCSMTYITHCLFADNNIPTEAVVNCSPYLFAEMDHLSAQINVVVGSLPFKAVCGDKYSLVASHGTTIWMGKHRIFPIFSPFYAERANKWQTFEDDLQILRQTVYA